MFLKTPYKKSSLQFKFYIHALYSCTTYKPKHSNTHTQTHAHAEMQGKCMNDLLFATIASAYNRIKLDFTTVCFHFAKSPRKIYAKIKLAHIT